jgi:hypothetical protein
MPADVLIEWTKSDHDPNEPADAIPDVSVFTDGRVRFGPRFGAGEIAWKELPPAELEGLRRFLFEEQNVLEIDEPALLRNVAGAKTERLRATRTATVEPSMVPQLDADTSILRVADAGRTREIRYYDLFGDAQRFPEIAPLQRLRAIERRMLQIAEEHAGRTA